MSQMLVLPYLDVSKGRQTITVDPGTNVAGMVALAFPGVVDLSRVRVVIGDHVISSHLWHAVRPRPGATVIVRVIPSNDNLRTVLSVAVLVAAVALGQYYAPTLAGALLPASFTGYGAATATAATLQTVAALSTAGFALAGTALLNAFIPPTSLGDQGNGTSVNGITGLQNTSNPGGVIPSILGTHRYAPVYAAPPYTEIVGDDQYVVASFLFGHGPLALSDHKLGNTPISAFSDIEMQIREGYDDDEPLTLYPQTVIEDQMSVELVYTQAVERYTARDASECSLDFAYVQGLVRYNENGSAQYQTSIIRIRYRLAGAPDYIEQATLNISANKQELIRRNYRFAFPERGQYQIEIKRMSPDSGSDMKVQDRVDLSCVRSFRPESPFNFPNSPLAMVAMRIRASNQLNSVVNNYNAIASLICPDWDADSETWITRTTSNPASLFRHVLQGPANAFPKTDGQVDIVGLEDFNEHCTGKALSYNRVHDYSATRLDVLRDIAAAGRATPHDDGIKIGVVIDRPQALTTYVSAISPRNSWDFQGSTPYVKFSDGHRVKFLDAANGWNQAECIVPFPGVDADAVEVTEDMEHPGVTNFDQIWKATRRRQYELIHRPHTYTVSQDFESLVLARGDLAALNHDVIDRDHVSARIRAVSGQSVRFDTIVTMEAGREYACIIRKSNGTSIRRVGVTVAGSVSTLALVGDLTGVAVGDLALFGTSIAGPAIDVLVKSIERGENLTARLTLVDASPQIDDLVDAETPPEWNGRVGGEMDMSGLIPAVPSISVDDAFLDFNVAITAGSGGVVLPVSYVVSYRIHGGGAFTTVTIPVAVGVAHISGFIVGDEIDVKARAVSSSGQSSADCAIVQATLHSATTSTPKLDSTAYTLDSTALTMDHF